MKLAILGCGTMGSAIVLGAVKQKVPGSFGEGAPKVPGSFCLRKFEFHLYDPFLEKAQKLAKEAKAKAHANMEELSGCEYFLLAVKPQNFRELAVQLKPILVRDTKIISIMAGVPTAKIREGLDCQKLARVMPNTPCLVGEGAAAIYFVSMSQSEKEVVKKIFAPIAQVHCVGSDDEVDLVTVGIASGSGYIFEIARILIEKLSAMGLDAKTADAMVKQMLKGSAALMQQSPMSAEELRNQVTSKGGTTEAALKIFSEKKLEEIFSEALDAAYRRAKELSK